MPPEDVKYLVRSCVPLYCVGKSSPSPNLTSRVCSPSSTSLNVAGRKQTSPPAAYPIALTSLLMMPKHNRTSKS